jgi:hypothetical protein
MVFNLKRRARERAIAAEIANELYFAWKPAMEAGATADALMTEHRQTFAHVFAAACERHGLQSEAEATTCDEPPPKCGGQSSSPIRQAQPSIQSRNGSFRTLIAVVGHRWQMQLGRRRMNARAGLHIGGNALWTTRGCPFPAG